MFKMILAAALCAGTGLVGAGVAQAAGPCGDGSQVIVRESRLTAAGSKAGLMDAFAAHKAWYVKAGLKDQFTMGPALEPAKGGLRPSDTNFISVHVYTEIEPKKDAGWDAFVAKYRANSSIGKEMRFCLAKGAGLTVK